MLGRQKRGMAPASPFVPRGVFLWTLSLSDMLLDEQLTNPSIPPTMCPSCSSDCCFHAVCWQAICPAFSPRVALTSSVVFQSQACCPLKLQALSPTGRKHSQNLVLLTFQANYYGGSLCGLPCVLVCLLSFSVTLFPSLPVAMLLFSPKLSLHHS